MLADDTVGLEVRLAEVEDKADLLATNERRLDVLLNCGSDSIAGVLVGLSDKFGSGSAEVLTKALRNLGMTTK